jgi:hypothetical protein
MAPHAFAADESRSARFGIKHDGLMTTIATRHLTTTATYTQLLIELGVDDGVAVEIIGLDKIR